MRGPAPSSSPGVKRGGCTIDDDPAVRCRHLYRGAAADPFGAGRQAAARRRADAVRLAGHRPDRAGEPGVGGARAEARGEDRQDAGARCRRMAPVDRHHPDRDRARSARPGADRDTHLLVRAHHRGAGHEGRGSPTAGRRLADPLARKRRQAARHALPSCTRRSPACLYRRCRHRRGSQGLAVPHQPAATMRPY